jgi:hypothetical protein
MKKIIYLAAGMLALNLAPVFDQTTLGQTTIQFGTDQVETSKSELTKFNLDFPGGTPADLVKAIEKASGKPLNAIIPTENADLQIPPLKMNDVNVPQLFAALGAASHKNVAINSNPNAPFNSYSQFTTGYEFKTSDNPVTDTSIWYFHVEKPSLPPVVSTEKVCRFYQLGSYLDRGFSVDDITMAIQTGWKMAGINPPPELNYHKETKLLIAYGALDDLNIIQSVLQSLPSSNATRSELNRLNSQIAQLTDQITQLKRQIPGPPQPPHVSPAEKSGK